MSITSWKKKAIVYIFLIIATFAVYWQVHQFEFLNFDDQVYILENHHLKSVNALDEIRWAFSTKHTGLWNPLLWVSFMLDYQLYGLDAGGYHLTNLILHILSSLLLFWLFCRMTGAVWKSAFVAGLFALHPLHVESVAWVAERKDVLSAFFWMLTLCLYVLYTEKETFRRYLLVLGSFVLALMSKPMVVTLPVILMLLDYWPLNRFAAKKENPFIWQVKEKLPFFVLSAALIGATLYAPDNPDMTRFPFLLRLLNAPVSFLIYLWKTFWPRDMAIFYPFPNQISMWHIASSILLIAAITVFVIVKTKRFPCLFVGWFWFVIAISPVLKIVQIGNDAMADRYHYLPSIGLAVMLAWGIPSMFRNESVRRKILVPSAATFLILMSIISWQQCSYWKNSIEIWNHALRVTKSNVLAYNRLGNAYGKKGQYQRAIENFTRAIRLSPDNPIAYNGIGIAYTSLNQDYLALKNYNEAIHLSPGYGSAWNNRAVIYLKQKNTKDGCGDAKKACSLGVCDTLNEAAARGLCQ